MVKNPLANKGDIRDMGSIPGSGDPLEEGIAIHSSILAWIILCGKELGWLWFIGSQRVRQN